MILDQGNTLSASNKSSSKKKNEKTPESETLGVNEVKSLVKLLESHGVTEFEFAKGDSSVYIKRGSESQVIKHEAPQQVFIPSPSHSLPPYQSAPQAIAHQDVASAPAPVAAEPAAAVDENTTDITSPMVGTFYNSPSPDSDPFISVGDKVKKGQTICIIEAMKVMNEIESDISGVVTEVCLQNAQVVEYGEPLFKVKPV